MWPRLLNLLEEKGAPEEAAWFREKVAPALVWTEVTTFIKGSWAQAVL